MSWLSSAEWVALAGSDASRSVKKGMTQFYNPVVVWETLTDPLGSRRGKKKKRAARAIKQQAEAERQRQEREWAAQNAERVAQEQSRALLYLLSQREAQAKGIYLWIRRNGKHLDQWILDDAAEEYELAFKTRPETREELEQAISAAEVSVVRLAKIADSVRMDGSE